MKTEKRSISKVMFKIWVKTYSGEKLTRNFLYEGEDKYEDALFRECVYAVCNELDIPSPVILPVHIRHFGQFNVVRFRADDFVESIDFDTMTMEYVARADKKRCKDLRLYP